MPRQGQINYEKLKPLKQVKVKPLKKPKALKIKKAPSI